MAFEPKEFLRVARCFSVPGLGEAEYRTAIGRALYGVFLRVRDVLEARGGQVVLFQNRGEEHGRVRQRFKEGKFKHAQVWQRLGSLYDLRNRSDYDLDTTIGQADVEQALGYADYIAWVLDNDARFSSPPEAS